MPFTHYDLGQQSAGATVRVTLRGAEANVMLLDSANLATYRRGGRFSYSGGHYRRSPVVLQVPGVGHWHVVVDLGGYAGRVESSVEVLS
jgi:hypothetical protein